MYSVCGDGDLHVLIALIGGLLSLHVHVCDDHY